MRSLLFASFSVALLLASTPVAAEEYSYQQSSDRQLAAAFGKNITRPSSDGTPAARFNGPICLSVSGFSDNIAANLKHRIAINLEGLTGIAVDPDPDCAPNAFIGTVSDADGVFADLRAEQSWLFAGLKQFQIDRISSGSDAVRAWHTFDVRNIDGTQLPRQLRDPTPSATIPSQINQIERASRFSQLRNDMVGAVLLVEAKALSGKSLQQFADYATMRLTASINDEFESAYSAMPSILTLFSNENAPQSMTALDRAYLEALYGLPASSKDRTVIAATANRYVDRKAAAPRD